MCFHEPVLGSVNNRRVIANYKVGDSLVNNHRFKPRDRKVRTFGYNSTRKISECKILNQHQILGIYFVECVTYSLSYVRVTRIFITGNAVIYFQSQKQTKSSIRNP
jgi:hypothetical protein